MKKYLMILGTVFVVSALTGWAIADDITVIQNVDDVYFWPEDRVVIYNQPQTNTNAQTVNQPVQPVQTSRITYIEDSVTQHSDTIVKAVIHR